jgi:hypothetical protein
MACFFVSNSYHWINDDDISESFSQHDKDRFLVLLLSFIMVIISHERYEKELNNVWDT